MPITYQIDETAERVTLRFLGTVTDAELMATFHQLYHDPHHRMGMAELTDFAVVVPAGSDVMFGLSRLYELLREGSPERVSVFQDIGETEHWLGDPKGAPASPRQTGALAPFPAAPRSRTVCGERAP